MAYLGGTLGSIVAGAGNAIIAGKELQEQDENIQLKKQQIAMGALALQNAQRQQQTQQVVGQFLSSEAAKDQSNVTDPVKAAGMYEKGAAMALQNGDFASADEMGELAKGKLAEAKQQMAVQQQEQQQKKESLASAADDYAANPTPEGYKDLARKAIDAGANPTQIPMPGTPQFASWLNQQQLASKTAAQRADFTQKAYEMDANRREKQQEHQDNVALRQANMQQTAMLREAMLADRQQALQMERERLDLDKQKFAAGGATGQRQSKQEADRVNAVVGNAAEAVRNLDVLSEMKIGTSNTPFANLHDESFLDAVAKAGTNILTPANTQMLASAQGGLVAELTNINVIGPGTRGPTQARIEEMHKALDFQPGSPPIVNLFRFANAADIARVRLKNVPDELLSPSALESKKEQMEILSKIPTPKQVYKAAQNSPYAAQINTTEASIADVSHELLNMTKPAGAKTEGTPGLPGSGTGNASVNVPPLPAGFKLDQ